MESSRQQGDGRRCPRVLCLHGAASGQRIFEFQAGRLFGQTRGRIEFIILEGPKDCTDAEAMRTMSMFQGSPMKEYDEVSFDEHGWPTYKAPREALRWLQSKLLEHAPIDGILGFSQGAGFAVMLAAQASAGVGADLAFACLLCPHAPGYVQQLPELFSRHEPLRVPTMVVCGEQEDYDEGFKETLRGKPINRMGCRMPSEHVLKLFDDVETLTHREGHRPIPADKKAGQELIERLAAFVQRVSRMAAAGNGHHGVVMPGAWVRLGDAGTGAPLDGPVGVVERWHSDSGLWVVSSDEPGDEFRVKRNHLAIQDRGPCVSCGSPTHHCRDRAGRWWCPECWGIHASTRREYALAEQGELFHRFLRAAEAAAEPARQGGGDSCSLEEASGGDGEGEEEEDPVEAYNFLLRVGLLPLSCTVDPLTLDGEPEGGRGDVDEEALRGLQPQPSPAQGIACIDSYSFTSAFDGGNALPSAWRREGEEDGIPVYSTRIARDCHGHASARSKNFWFNFGVTPIRPEDAAGASIRLTVRGMSQQADLFDHGYAPWCCTPSSGAIWRRVVGDVQYGREDGAGGGSGNDAAAWQLSWVHTFGVEEARGTSYFAFCHPYSYADMLRCLAGIERAAASPGEALLDFHCLQPVAPRVGEGVYFHRQLLARSPRGRSVELLTVTRAPGAAEASGPYDELPSCVRQALSGLPSVPPLRFPGRPVCFVSGRVHPGETPGQFAVLGFLQFLLSDDPRAALLRSRFVFKLVPMLNPDGVAWGHSRTNSLGHDLNRCYQQPSPEEHEGVAAVKAVLMAWAERGELLFYLDCHGHAAVRGCFLFGNDLPGEDEGDFLWSVAYAHAAQLNCPHIDIENCLWSTAPRPGLTTPDHDSGRNQIGQQCGLYHAYTLECNYNCGRLVRPVSKAPGLPTASGQLQSVRGMPMSRTRGRLAPVAYDPLAWAAVGEGLAVALLDLHAEHPHSRLLSQLPAKYIHSDKGERAHQPQVLKELAELWLALAARHSGASEVPAAGASGPVAARAAGRQPEAPEPVPHKGAVCAVTLDAVPVHGRPSADEVSPLVGMRWQGDRVTVLEECSHGWVRVQLSAVRSQDESCPAGKVFSGTEIGYIQAHDKELGLPALRALPHAWPCHRAIQRCHAPALDDVRGGLYPPPVGCCE